MRDVVICPKCDEDKPPREFAKMSGPRGRPAQTGVGYICKECVRETSKASIRQRITLPRFERLIRAWPDRQIQTEIDWYLAKLSKLAEERIRRSKQ